MTKRLHASPLHEPPSVASLPKVPKGYQAAPIRDFRGFRPTSEERQGASVAIGELRRFTTYAALFGVLAPDANDVADALEMASRWRELRAPLEALDAFVRVEDAKAWMNALLLVEDLRPVFALAVKKNPSLAHSYPGLARLFGAAKLVGKAASRTKAKKKKAKAKAATLAAKAQAVAAKSEAAAAAKAAKPASVPASSVVINSR